MAEFAGLGILLLVSGALLVAVLTGLVVHGARRPPPRTAGYAVARGLACDPGEAGLAFESWEVDRGGARLPVWEVKTRGAEAPDPGLTAVLVHGWGQSRIDMLARLRPWDRLVTRCLLYDLRGHGEAEGAASDLGCGEERDLLALLEQAGAGPFVLVGHSMGAVIALAAAASGHAAAARIRGVVAYGAYTDFHVSLRGRLRSNGLPTRPVTDLALAWLALRGVRHRDVAPRARALPCPLFLVHGTEDRIAPVDHALALAATAPDAHLHRVEGAGHRDTHGAAGADHDAALLAFVRRIAAGEDAGDGPRRGSERGATVVACAARSEEEDREEATGR